MLWFRSSQEQREKEKLNIYSIWRTRLSKKPRVPLSIYELNNQIRLINVQEYPIDTSDGFIGFICGIICQDHDLEQMYLDSFLKLACLEGADIEETYKTLETISEKYHVKHIHECSRSSRVRERKCCSIFIRDSK